MNIIYNLFLNSPVVFSLAAILIILSALISFTIGNSKDVRWNKIGEKTSNVLFMLFLFYAGSAIFARAINYIITSWV